MNFRSILAPYKAGSPISHRNKTVWLGSCFTDAIGTRMQQRKFPTLINPFGNIFNPLSIAYHLQQSIQPAVLENTAFVFHDDLWHCWHHHGIKSVANKDTLINTIREDWQQTGNWIKHSNVLFITLGSAWVYTHLESGITVANCHKVPNTQFSKRLLSVHEIVTAFERVFTLCKEVNKELNIVLTVSPVKHLRDGIAENNRSKALLLLAAHELAEKQDGVHYFPAFELINDDLRDYRFYAEDLAHPTVQAENYVWEYFSNAFFTEETQSFISQIEALQSGIQHKAFNPESKAHQSFLQQLLKRAENLQHLGLDTFSETELIKSKLV